MKKKEWFGRIAVLEGKAVPVITDLEVKAGKVAIFTGEAELLMEPYMMKAATQRADLQRIEELVKMKSQ